MGFIGPHLTVKEAPRRHSDVGIGHYSRLVEEDELFPEMKDLYSLETSLTFTSPSYTQAPTICFPDCEDFEEVERAFELECEDEVLMNSKSYDKGFPDMENPYLVIEETPTEKTEDQAEDVSKRVVSFISIKTGKRSERGQDKESERNDGSTKSRAVLLRLVYLPRRCYATRHVLNKKSSLSSEKETILTKSKIPVAKYFNQL